MAEGSVISRKDGTLLILARGLDGIVVLECRGVRIEIMLTRIDHERNQAMFGITAPREVAIFRKEIEGQRGFGVKTPAPVDVPPADLS